jgi:probable HAF family extracellular repeat protein
VSSLTSLNKRLFLAHAIGLASALISLGLAATTDAGVAAPPSYTLTDLGSLMPVSYSGASGINNNGDVVGEFGVNGDDRAFLYSGGAVQQLGVLPGETTSRAFRINSSGQIVGLSGAISNADQDHAFLYSGGNMQDLGTLGGSSSSVSAINAAGQIVGESKDAAGYSRAFLYSGGVMQNIGATYPLTDNAATAINDSGEVVVEVDGVAGVDGFVYTAGHMQPLGSLGGSITLPWAINNAGQVAGTSLTSAGAYHVFLYSNGKMQDLGALNSGAAFAYDINNVGQIVGQSNAVGQDLPHGFLYTDGAMYDLNNLITDAPPGCIVETASGINDQGQIAATARNGWGEDRAVLLTPTAVPLPSAAAMAISAATLLAAAALWRRKQKPGQIGINRPRWTP